MLDQVKQIALSNAAPQRKPIVSYAKDSQLTGKFALPLAAVGFGFAIVTRRSKVLFVLIGATVGFGIESVMNAMQKQ